MSCLPCPRADGQEAAGFAQVEEATVTFNFPQEIPIQALVDYVSERLGIKILYDEQIADKKINVKAPGEIPVSSLLGVLESALKMKDLVLVDTEVEGWKRIVASEQLVNVAPLGDPSEAIEKFGKGVAVTQAFVLKQASPQQVDEIIKPFLTQPGGNSIPLPESGTLIVTDYATNLIKIARWIDFIDRPRPEARIEFVPLEHAQVADVAGQITAVLAAKVRAEGGRELESQVELIEDERTNQLLLVGPEEEVEEAKQLIRSLDVPLNLITETYSFVNVAAATIDQAVQHLIGKEVGERFYRSFIDEDTNQLIVTGTAENHRLIEHLQATRDVPPDQVASPIRFYKIKNLPVIELLQTIQAIESGSPGETSSSPSWRRLPTDGRIRPMGEGGVPGPNRLPGAGGHDLPLPPAVRQPDAGDAPETPTGEVGGGSAAAQLLGGVGCRLTSTPTR